MFLRTVYHNKETTRNVWGETQRRNQPKMFDFRRTTAFCLGCRLLKHKITIQSYKFFGGGIPPGYAYAYGVPSTNRVDLSTTWNIPPLDKPATQHLWTNFDWNAKISLNVKLFLHFFHKNVFFCLIHFKKQNQAPFKNNVANFSNPCIIIKDKLKHFFQSSLHPSPFFDSITGMVYSLVLKQQNKKNKHFFVNDACSLS